MKVELHCHTNRYSACSIVSPQELVEHLIDAGYGAVYLTEHNAVWSEAELQELRERFEGIRIFPGIERTVGAHDLLILGTSDPAYLAEDDPSRLLARAQDDGCLTVLAHPFRWDHGADLLRAGLLPDAIEYRTCNHDGVGAAAARRCAEGLGLAMVNAGDVHAVGMIDQFWIETDGPVEQAGDIRRIVLGGAYHLCGEES